MPRSTGGTYALPLSPFQNGTVIRSSEVNEKFADLGAEMTGSLSRDGNGGMRAPLELIDGSAPQPAFGFLTDPQAGLWCPAGNTVEMVASATALQRWTTSAVSIYKPLTVTGNTAVTGNLSATGTFSATGNATLGGTLAVTGASTFTGAATVNAALTATPSSGNTTAATLTGAGTGYGAVITGGASGDGATITAVASNATGAIITGGAGGVGLRARAGTAASATVPTYDIVPERGYIAFADAVVKPNSNVALKNAITPANICKVLAFISIPSSKGTGTFTDVVSGFNVTSITIGTSTVTVNFAQAFASATYGAWVKIHSLSSATSSETFTASALTITLTGINPSTTTTVMSVTCFGLQ